MFIGNVYIDKPIFSAPLAGVSDTIYRQLAKEAGAGLVCAEMVSAKGLIYNRQKALPLLRFSVAEKPISFQVFGSDPKYMSQAAQELVALGADIIDINMGCPVQKVVKKGEGCALMRDVSQAAEIISAVVEAVSIPVTVKIRKGWDDEHVNAVEMALLAESKGASAVTVHGRTREQFYSGKVDLDIIRQVAAALKIPVVGNGDIFSPQDALHMFKMTGCAAIMIARGGMGNPWLFKRTQHYLKTGELLPLPTALEKIQMAVRHLELLVSLKGEKIAVRQMRKHTSWYIKGLRNAASVRQEICRITTREEMKKKLLQYAAAYCQR